LFQVMFVLQNVPQEALELPGLAVTPWDVDTGTSKFDLTLRLTERDGGLRGELEYSTELFEEDTAARLVGHFRALLQAACAAPGRPLAQLRLLTGPELLRQGNATSTAFDARPAPAQARTDTDGAYVAPRNPVEEAVAKVWAELLGVERVG